MDEIATKYIDYIKVHSIQATHPLKHTLAHTHMHAVALGIALIVALVTLHHTKIKIQKQEI